MVAIGFRGAGELFLTGAHRGLPPPSDLGSKRRCNSRWANLRRTVLDEALDRLRETLPEGLYHGGFCGNSAHEETHQ